MDVEIIQAMIYGFLEKRYLLPSYFSKHLSITFFTKLLTGVFSQNVNYYSLILVFNSNILVPNQGATLD